MPDFWRRNVTAPNQWLQNCILFLVRSTNFQFKFSAQIPRGLHQSMAGARPEQNLSTLSFKARIK